MLNTILKGLYYSTLLLLKVRKSHRVFNRLVCKATQKSFCLKWGSFIITPQGYLKDSKFTYLRRVPITLREYIYSTITAQKKNFPIYVYFLLYKGREQKKIQKKQTEKFHIFINFPT